MLHGVAGTGTGTGSRRSRFLGTLPNQSPTLTHPAVPTRPWALVHPHDTASPDQARQEAAGKVPRMSEGRDGTRQ